jgi:hypothetical protein
VSAAGADDRDRAAEGGRIDVGEEVTRLTEALTGWWTSLADGPQGPRAAAGPEGARPDGTAAGDAHGGARCRACPLCRAIDLARAVRPDLLETVALAAETVALLLREATAGGRPAEPRDVWAEAVDTDPLGAGTPIAVTDADEASTSRGEQEEGRRSWG